MITDEVFAHCDIPCKIYDPIVIQVAALSVVRIMDIINETSHDDEKENVSELSRLTAEKENQARIVKDEVRIIWGDYFKEPQIKAYPKIHDLVHQIMMQGSKCKQGIDRKNGETLVDLVNEFSEIFWATKDIETKRVTAPYPPSLEMVYPIIDGD
jgi:nickel superoxide dismutase